jgi:DNA-binding IclR family transcriptional regulator
LRAVVAGGGSPFRTRLLAQLDLPKSTAQAALGSLVASATVERRDGTFALVDPLFAEWIATMREAGEADRG